MNFNSILIGTDDAERLRRTTPGSWAPRRSRTPGYTAWGSSGSGWVTVGPHSEVKGSNVAPGRLIWNIETSDVQGDFERFKAAGAIVVREPYDFDADGTMSTASIATLADPDGNYFQLTSPLEM